MATSDRSKAEKRIRDLEAALAEYGERFGLTPEARRLLIEDPYRVATGENHPSK